MTRRGLAIWAWLLLLLGVGGEVVDVSPIATGAFLTLALVVGVAATVRDT